MRACKTTNLSRRLAVLSLRSVKLELALEKLRQILTCNKAQMLQRTSNNVCKTIKKVGLAGKFVGKPFQQFSMFHGYSNFLEINTTSRLKVLLKVQASNSKCEKRGHLGIFERPQRTIHFS